MVIRLFVSIQEKTRLYQILKVNLSCFLSIKMKNFLLPEQMLLFIAIRAEQASISDMVDCTYAIQPILSKIMVSVCLILPITPIRNMDLTKSLISNSMEINKGVVYFIIGKYGERNFKNDYL